MTMDHRLAEKAELNRLRDGMAKVEAIASAIMPNPGLEKNTVELVEDMAFLIQQLRQEKHALLNQR